MASLLRTIAGAALALLLALAAPPAAAQWRGPRPLPREVNTGGLRYRLPPPEGRPRPSVGFAAEVTTGFGTRRSVLGGVSSTYSIVSPLVRAYVRVAEHWALDAAYGFSASSETDGAYSGNPYVGASYLADAGDGTLRVGVGVTAPLAGGALDEEDLLGQNLALATRLGYDAFLWTPRGLAVVVPSRIETYTSVLLAAELTVGAVWSLDAADGGASASGIFQIVGEIAGPFGDVDVGARVGATYAYLLTPYLEPFVRAHLGAAVLYARASLPLSETGRSLTAGYWGLHLGLGAELP